ncbi:MAG: hypothetical protein KF890_14550, partial [Nitrospira sp.]|nr:hypothetical protein [Nitrospira sp.]
IWPFLHEHVLLPIKTRGGYAESSLSSSDKRGARLPSGGILFCESGIWPVIVSAVSLQLSVRPLVR